MASMRSNKSQTKNKKIKKSYFFIFYVTIRNATTKTKNAHILINSFGSTISIELLGNGCLKNQITLGNKFKKKCQLVDLKKKKKRKTKGEFMWWSSNLIASQSPYNWGHTMEMDQIRKPRTKKQYKNTDQKQENFEEKNTSLPLMDIPQQKRLKRKSIFITRERRKLLCTSTNNMSDERDH